MSLPHSSASTTNEPQVLSVAALTDQIKGTLEANFVGVWVAGEISNFSRPQSGHCYLTLKDERAQLRAVIWRGTAQRTRFDLHDGLEVICCGDLEIYPPRGTYQLVIRQIEPKGIGALELALRQLRDKLAAEGLFDPRHKRPLPRYPKRVAFITSPTGAAIRDFLQVLRRRWLGTDVLVVPTRVQGEGASAEIATALAAVNRLQPPVDIIVVGRGGGSLEDLWSFNEEVLVRAVRASKIPVVSAVGHEIDVTLCDLAADVRALTPSEAAELVAPAREELHARLLATQQRMLSALAQRAALLRRRLDNLASARAMTRPLELVHERAQMLDELGARARRAIAHTTEVADHRVRALAGRLESLSPLAVLGRGYSLTTRAADGLIVRDAAQVVADDELVTHVSRGQIISRVLRTQPPIANQGEPNDTGTA
ncbi:MAG: exodeoxyribonuclease VII large subunit [Planctomycetes bacterium]|nr:exodeoxyribonuclease VII large subunit [Planctomycetota bacterium]